MLTTLREEILADQQIWEIWSNLVELIWQVTRKINLEEINFGRSQKRSVLVGINFNGFSSEFFFGGIKIYDKNLQT